MKIEEFGKDYHLYFSILQVIALKFWFRYIFRNQSLIKIGDEKSLTARILNDLQTHIGRSFEILVREVLIERNTDGIIPFKFTKSGKVFRRSGQLGIQSSDCNRSPEQVPLKTGSLS